jgi:hypothetical protein
MLMIEPITIATVARSSSIFVPLESRISLFAITPRMLPRKEKKRR